MHESRPWNDPELFPLKPDEHTYGYLKSGKPVVCTREELIAACASESVSANVGPVWTPETPRTVPAAFVECLFPAILAKARSSYWNGIGIAVVNVLVFTVLLATTSLASSKHAPRNGDFLFLIFILYSSIPIVENAIGLLRVKNLKWPFPDHAQTEIRYQYWLGTQSQRTSVALFALLMIVISLEHFASLKVAVETAGLAKDKVRSGEYWRLLTGTLLHANMIHFFMNGMFLLNVGQVLEALFHRWIVPLVFLISALAGSICSLLFLDATSVGASGGLMGLLGFLGVSSYRNRNDIPMNYSGMAIKNTLLIGAIGVVGYEFIDNAAHGGGLLAGALLGIFVDPTYGRTTTTSARLTRRLGLVAAAVLSLAWLGVCYLLVQRT